MVVRASASQVRLFSRSEYELMAAQGILRPEERVELVAGEILVMTPQGSRHSTVVNVIVDALRNASPGTVTRVQQPLILDPDSEPEPDIAIVSGTHHDYLNEHPRTAVLVVEVADSSLRTDRNKAGVYARAGVREYWIANLVDDVLEVHRDPHDAGQGVWAYRDVKRVEATQTLQPLTAPQLTLKVADLLP